MHADPRSDPGGIRTRDLHGESVATTTTSPLGHVLVARVGVEPTNSHEGLSFVALPVCVPRHFKSDLRMPFCGIIFISTIRILHSAIKSVPDGICTHGLHRDRVASTPS